MPWTVCTRAASTRAPGWVVNLIDSVLEVYREPVRDAEAPFGWRYARRDVLDATMVARPLAAPQAAIRVADLLP